MYEEFYGLKAKPFQLSADPNFLFTSQGHRRAMSYLVYGAHQGEGFIAITGEVGAGKTMLARTLARKMKGQNVVFAQIVSTSLEADDIVRMVAAAFGVAHDGSKAGVLSAIEHFLFSSHRANRRVLLVVDEAQNLPPRSLEELRMLSNYVCDDRPVLQTFLLGQPEFRKTLQSPDLEQLRQRIIASCHLGPLDREETEAYIVHRLQVADWKGDPSFSYDALAAIYQSTGGVPRRINLLCDRLLLMGRLDEKHSFTGKDVANLAEEMRQEFAPAEPLPAN